MRILLTNHFPYDGSGTGTYTRDLATGLLDAGHEVRALIVDGPEISESDRCPTTRVICGGPAGDLDFPFPCFTGHPRSARLFGDLTPDQVRAYRRVHEARLREILNVFKPDVVHCQHLWIQPDIARSLGARYIVSAQGTDMMGYTEFPRFQRSAARAAAGAARILAASQYIAKQVVGHFPTARQRTITLHSAIDPRPYQRAAVPRSDALRTLGVEVDHRPIVAFLGKLVPFKGVDSLVQATSWLHHTGHRVHTVICGDGPLRATLERMAHERAPGCVTFIGNRAVADRALLLQAADVLAVPSRAEPFGLVALEAMASGTPVVAVGGGGISEILPNRGCYILKTDSASALGDILQRVTSERWKHTRGDDLRAHVAALHDPRTWVARLEAVYDAVMQEPIASPACRRGEAATVAA